MDLRLLDKTYDVTNKAILKDDGRWTCYQTPASRTGYELVAMLALAKRHAEVAAEAEAKLRTMIEGLFENEVKP